MNWKYLLFVGALAVGSLLYVVKEKFLNKEANVAHWTFKTLDGKIVTMEDYKGKNVVLNFWKTWCSPCMKEMPILEEARKQLGPDFVFLSPSDEDMDKVRIFKETNDYGFTFLSSMKFSLLGVVYYPETFVIDKEGNVVKHQLGAFKYNGKVLADSLKYWTSNKIN